MARHAGEQPQIPLRGDAPTSRTAWRTDLHLPHFSALQGQAGVVAKLTMASFALQVVGALLPVLWQVFFDRILVSRSLDLLQAIVLCMAAGAMGEGLLVYFVIRRGNRLSSYVDHSLTGLVLRKFLQLPLHYFERKPKGELAAQVGEVAAIRLFLASTGMQLVSNVVLLALILSLMTWYNPLLAGIVAACIPVLAGFTMLLHKSVRADYNRQRAARTRIAAVLNHGLNGIVTIKSMALEKSWLERWTAASSEAIEANSAAARLHAIESTVLRVVQRLIVLAVMWAGAVEFLAGRLSAGQLVACYMFALRVVEPSTRMVHLWQSYISYREASRHLDELLAEAGETAGQSPEEWPEARSVVLEDVTFRYPEKKREVLRHVNLVLTAGTSAAIVGPSGCGKSTLTRLMQRHILPDSGRITINGVDIREYDPALLRTRVILLTHDATLFDTSIAENIVAKQIRDAERLALCCQVVGLDVLLSQLPQGLETRLAEGGPSLSAGQRQRIALARALYARPDVLILDEATNGMDAASESSVLREVAAAMSAGILLVITHRVDLLEGFHWVGHLEEGHLLELENNTRPPSGEVHGAAGNWTPEIT